MKRLRRAAIIAAFVHLVAAAGMAFILSQGLETNPSLLSRLHFIVNNRGLWTIGWLCWTGAALSFLNFADAFASAYDKDRLAVILAAAAVATDLTGQTIAVFLLPHAASNILGSDTSAYTFLLLYRISVMFSGFVGNTFYTTSALFLILGARRIHPRSVTAAGFAVVAVGVALSIAALLGSLTGLVWTNAMLPVVLLVWLALIARHCGRDILRENSEAQ